MSVLLLNESAAPNTPAGAKVAVYADNSANPQLRFIDDGGNQRTLVDNNNTVALANKTYNGQTLMSNFSTAGQVIAAATRTYITGTRIAVPPGKLQIGTVLRWTISLTKTAAGIAPSTFDICVGTAGTTADTARVSFTKPAGTAAIDEGKVVIEAVVRGPLSGAGVMVAEFTLIHNGNTAGHATVPCVVLNAVSAGFDVTVANLFVGVCITSGAADAVTIQLVDAEVWNL